MKVKQQEFPHPLLSSLHGDYASGSFTLSVTENPTDKDEFRFWCIYKLDCPSLNDYVVSGKARVVVRFKSAAASFRENYFFEGDAHKKLISVPKQGVAKSIVIQAFIVAADNISDFRLPEWNQEYFSGAIFSLRKGDILAESDIFEVKLDDSELEKPLSSIFKIECNEEAKDSIHASFDDHKIRVLLSKQLYDIYFKLRKKGEFRRYLSAVILLPPLVEALSLMQTEYDEDDNNHYENYRWYRAICHKLPTIGLDRGIEDLLEQKFSLATIANRLLGDVSWDALNSLKTTIDDINNNSDTIESEMRD